MRFRRLASRLFRMQKLERRQLLASDLDFGLEPDTWWQDTGPVQAALQQPTDAVVSPEISPIRAQDFRLLTADRESLFHSIESMASGKGGRSSLAVPRPDGGLDTFLIQPTQVMAPELAAKFPSIVTFAGESQSGSGDKLYADLSPSGFRAMVVSQQGNYYVDPFYYFDDRLYASYFAGGEFLRDNQALRHEVHEHFHDHSDEGSIAHSDSTQSTSVHGASQAESESTSDAQRVARSGAQLRVYRTAIAATGEYTAFHGGKVADAQAAIVTAINRVSGIFETELSVRLELIANNDSLIYTDAGSDPYTNNDGNALLDENQTNIDAVIGSVNYDIGHVFSTGGGGLATLGIVGIDGAKAEGQTGLANPIGDAFYVDYVAHEVGHQFGAEHTFNGDSGACASGREAGSAFEPGSGTTIMGYAGICGDDNIQSSSDPYFHSASFDEIISHVDTVIPAVGTRIATGNSIPTVDAGNDYVIPAQTPFQLTAVGSDGDAGDLLTYNWEQRDLGPAKDLAAPDDGQGPLFRSVSPSTDPTRVFPNLLDLLNGVSDVAEQLPQTTRTMNFRATIRDNALGGGGVNTDDMQISVVNTGFAFEITSPNTNVNWPALSSQTVQWNVASTETAPINATHVNILLSTDGGLTFNQTLAAGVPNDGSESITVPNSLTSNARIRVEPVGNIFFDVSDVDFAISENVSAEDFGDAPSPYPVVLADNGPRHTVGGPRLGVLVDTEANGQADANALGDGKDEDGLKILQPLVAGQTIDVQVSATGAGQLDLFVDFDGNGVFGNQPNEIIRTAVVDGVQTIPLAIPANAVENTIARLRISTAGGLDATGPAADGEVEDHAVRIFASPPSLDFGDALGYPTLVGEDGARHVINDLFLGEAVDAEPNGQPSLMAVDDGRDDDGVVFRELFLPGQLTLAEVTVSAPGVLDYFIDWDQDGVFGNDVNEVYQSPLVAGTQLVLIDVPVNAMEGVTFARFRFSELGGLAPTGLADNGEVEDYQIVVIQPASETLFEDFDGVTAPQLPSGWTASQNVNQWVTQAASADSNPNSAFVPNIDSESDATLDSPTLVIQSPDTVIRFENHYDTEEDFDGGVLEISVNGAAFVDILSAGAVFLEGGYNGDIDSDFGNPLAGRAAWTGNSNGYIQTAIQLPASMDGQSVQLRWRFGTDESIASNGWRIDTVTVDDESIEFDFGDALGAGYPTTVTQGGAAHAFSLLSIGFLIDFEADGIPTAAADGDDTTQFADEDGIVFPSTMGPGAQSLNVASTDAAILNVWIDVDADGNWDSTADHVIKDRAIEFGVSDIPFELPASLATGPVPARVRVSKQSGLAAGGLAGDGEVEDYLVNLVGAPPVAVESVLINDGADQRSFVSELIVRFDGQTNASSSAFIVRNRDDQTIVPTTTALAVMDGKTVATITFDPGLYVQTRNSMNSLVDGNFELIIDATGVPGLAGDYLFGDEAVDSFFRLFGDADGDRDVDTQDLGPFALSLNLVASDSGFDPRADWDGDGDVDGLDYAAVRNRFNRKMPF